MKAWIARLVAVVRGRPDVVEGLDGEPLMNRQQAEAFLDALSFDWRRHGEVLPGIKVGDRWLYAEDDLVAWLNGVDEFVVVDDEHNSRA